MTTPSQRMVGIAELRERAAGIKKHVLANLDHYLLETEKQVTAHAGHVVFAQTIDEAVDYIRALARERGVDHLVGASATALADEVGALRQEIESRASEFGSYLAGPAAPPDRAASFEMECLLEAGIGVTGASFVLADTGAVCLAENDDFGCLSSAAPKIHVVVAGMESILPRTRDLAVFLRLLSDRFPHHISLLSGKRRDDEMDGPDEFHLILLDGGRSALLADLEKRELLQCIRCGACLENCPVTPAGHPGALTQLLSLPPLAGPFLAASTLCGTCREVCPVKIDLPRLLVALRQDHRLARSGWRTWLFRVWAFLMQRPRLYEISGLMIRSFWPAAWKGQRPATKSFRQLWRERKN